MWKNSNSLDDKKFQTLLHVNECLNNRVLLNVRLYYDIGIVTASSVILLGIYSVVNKVHMLLFAIPLLIVLGEVFHLHLTYKTMKFEWHMIKNIECKFDKMVESEILNFTREIGIFRYVNGQRKNTALSKFKQKKWLPYLCGYIFFCLIAFIFNYGEPIWIILFMIIYLLILLGLAFFIGFVDNKFSYYSEEIIKLKQSKNWYLFSSRRIPESKIKMLTQKKH